MKVEDEWDRDPEATELADLLFVTFDPNRIKVEQLLETVRKAGFAAEVRKKDAGDEHGK